MDLWVGTRAHGSRREQNGPAPAASPCEQGSLKYGWEPGNVRSGCVQLCLGNKGVGRRAGASDEEHGSSSAAFHCVQLLENVCLHYLRTPCSLERSKAAS